MILSKQNLQVVELTKPDKNIPVLDCVNVLEDGTTVAGNGKCFIAVSPVPEKITEKAQKVYGNGKCSRVNVSSTTVREVLKNIPADKQYGGMLEHAEVQSSDSKGVRFILYDGARKRNIDGKINPAQYPPFKKLFGSILSKNKTMAVRINVSRFLALVDTMTKCSGCSGNMSKMDIEFTSDYDIIVGMTNEKTGQECIGIMWTGESIGDAEGVSKWKEGLKDGDDSNRMSSINSNSGNNGDHPAGNKQLYRKQAKRTGNTNKAFPLKTRCPECNSVLLRDENGIVWCSSIKCRVIDLHL